MPLPRWLAQINKRVFNPRELKRGVRPVLTHLGRTSGKTYHTPLEAYPVGNGYMFILMYGSGSDWAKNVTASGTATLRVDGHDVELVSPRVVPREVAWPQLPETVKPPPNFMRVTGALQMDISGDTRPPQ